MKRFNTKQRTLLLVLPLFVLPFILAFSWAGQGITSPDGGKVPKGLRTALPEPVLKERQMDKMALYEQEAKASKKRQEQLRMDPYLKKENLVPEKEQSGLMGLSGNDRLGEKENALLDKLQLLDKQVRQADQVPTGPKGYRPATVQQKVPTDLSQDVRQLEALMDRMQPTGPDHELQQLEGMLDKILDVQHPERVEGRIREKALERLRFTVETDGHMQAKNKQHADQAKMEEAPRNAFYGLEEPPRMEHAVKAAITAEVAEETTFEGKGRIKVKLLEDVRVNGLAFPKGSLVYGEASLDGDRVKLVVSALRSGKHILPVALEAHDADAMPGIPIGGSIGQEINRGAGEALVTGMPNMASGMTLETQMASAGISTAKGLFRKKNKAVTITLKAGHPILLVNTKNS
ncbi:conjugative transposon protein TraM [Echinicola rosea]|uniref:Conjugative transposon protein TraM n=1 Tax=Echinicola rosea TaxID=1807691 RepID=A0ABQ1V7F3_9BACT|nr:conjugative transposon protein TraM [Echinicola rosea]GGF42679.1 conjugative transposon protein TraM [Echinicola rosea]